MDRKERLAKLAEAAELLKLAQDMDQTPEEDPAKGEEIAEKVFDKFLNELDFDSIG